MFEIIGFILLYFLIGTALTATVFVLDKNNYLFDDKNQLPFYNAILFWPVMFPLSMLVLLWDRTKIFSSFFKFMVKIKNKIWNKNGA